MAHAATEGHERVSDPDAAKDGCTRYELSAEFMLTFMREGRHPLPAHCSVVQAVVWVQESWP